MKILCIDDDYDELRRAEKAVADAGHTFLGAHMNGRSDLRVAIALLKDVDAVITDLSFNPVSKKHVSWKPEGKEPPAGLIVVIEAMHVGKPVALCTAMDMKNDISSYHHGARYGWLYDGALSGVHHRLCTLKDWGWAVENVEKQFAKGRVT